MHIYGNFLKVKFHVILVNVGIKPKFARKHFHLDIPMFEMYITNIIPNDLKTFEYWQSCLHKWPSHPYRLEEDRNVEEYSGCT